MYFRTPEGALNWLAKNHDGLNIVSQTDLIISMLKKYDISNLHSLEEDGQEDLPFKASIFYEIISVEQPSVEMYVVVKQDLNKILQQIKNDDCKMYIMLQTYIDLGFLGAMQFCSKLKHKLYRLISPLNVYLSLMGEFATILHANDYILHDDLKNYYVQAEFVYKKMLEKNKRQNNSKVM